MRSTTPSWALLGLCCAAALAGAEAPKEWANDLAPIGKKDWNEARAAHLLERAGFGGTPEEVARLAKMSPREAVDYLVDYHKVEHKPAPFDHSGIYVHGHKLVPLQEVVVSGLLTGKAYGVKATQPGKLKYQPAVDEFYALLISEHAEMRRASQWWLERMVTTPRPLEEKLTLFWHDHFATSQEKVLNYELMIAQVETLRKHASGKYRDLLLAVARDPAMLIWLDNRENVEGKPNENFAREVMELFCMGEGQGYTEADIREMARAFTGWTMRKPYSVKDDPKFVNNRWLHDRGVKQFLGKQGHFEGEQAIDIILRQPATPRFLTRKLYRYFVRDEINRAVHEKLAKQYFESKYDTRALLKTIFLSRDFYSKPTVGTQIKAPVPFLVSTYRKLGLRQVPGIPDCIETCGALGQVLFYPPNVAGWPGGRAWINPATLLARGNFVQKLLFPVGPGKYAPDKLVAEGYRTIPLLFKEYKITPRIWDPAAKKMKEARLAEYEEYLARLGPAGKKASMGKPPPMKGEMKSKMMEMAAGEEYNLAVGVYTGFVTAYDRVKPIARTKARPDLVAMVKTARADTPEAVVDYFCRRFLIVKLHEPRRAAVVAFLRKELAADKVDFTSPSLETALRRTVHLILSAPEFQLG